MKTFREQGHADDDDDDDADDDDADDDDDDEDEDNDDDEDDLVIHADANWEVDHIVVGVSEGLQRRCQCYLEKERGNQFCAVLSNQNPTPSFAAASPKHKPQHRENTLTQ